MLDAVARFQTFQDLSTPDASSICNPSYHPFELPNTYLSLLVLLFCQSPPRICLLTAGSTFLTHGSPAGRGTYTVTSTCPIYVVDFILIRKHSFINFFWLHFIVTANWYFYRDTGRQPGISWSRGDLTGAILA